MAKYLYRVMRDRSTTDKRLVLRALSHTVLGEDAESKELALNALRLCTDEIGRVPSRRAYDGWRAAQRVPTDQPSARFIRTRFRGTWRNALAAAGLDGAPDVTVRRLTAHGTAFSRAELVAGLRLCATDLGRHDFSQATYVDWSRRKLFSKDSKVERLCTAPLTFQRVFGSWVNAKAAAFEDQAATRPVALTRPELYAFLRQAAAATHPAPLTVARYEEWRKKQLASNPHARVPHGQTIVKQLGGWILGLVAAGMIDLAEAARRTKRPGRYGKRD